MSANHGLELSEFFPSPKVVEIGETESALAIDVRLATRNVLPIQRKAVRSILTAAGVRVVANKKTYVVDASVEDPSTFDMSKVPEAVRREYYELEVRGSEVYIRSPYQNGMVWAAQTLAALFHQLLAGRTIPNLIIRDWPELPVRGLMIEGHWGVGRMGMYDWCQLFDNMSVLKLNTLCLGLYDCRAANRCQGDTVPAEFLNYPFSTESGKDIYLHRARERWYHAGGDFWHDEMYVPPMTQKNLLSEIIAYAKEHGVNVVPMFSLLGHNTLIPRLNPVCSAVDSRGRATGLGFCLAGKKSREFIAKFLGTFLDTYYPTGAEYFHIRFDEPTIDYPHVQSPTKKEKPGCRCKACSAKKDEDRVADYLLWLCGVLVEKGVGKVVVWQKYVATVPGLMTKKFAARLAKAGLKDRLVVHSMDVAGTADDCLSWKPATAAPLGAEQWLGMMFCHSDGSQYERYDSQVDQAMRLAIGGKASGAVALTTGDVTHLDQEALLACQGWESVGKQTKEKIEKRWAQHEFGAGAEAYLATLALLAKAGATPAMASIGYLQYCEPCDAKPWPRPYPEEALQTMEALPDAGASLAMSAKQAVQAREEFRRLLNNDSLSSLARESLNSLIAESMWLDYVSRLFGWLLDVRAAAAGDAVKKSHLTACAEFRQELVSTMKQFETLKPNWIVPHDFRVMSYLLLFLDQLHEDINTKGGHRKAEDIRWSLPADWKVPLN